MRSLTFKEIAEALRSFPLPDCDLVAGIGTGGVVPASLVAYQANRDLIIVQFNYRDEENRPRYDAPVLQRSADIPEGVRRILLVDDVSVTGRTLDAARSLFEGYEVATLVMKGKADYVVFPDIATCVKWPWKPEPIPSVQAQSTAAFLPPTVRSSRQR